MEMFPFEELQRRQNSSEGER